MKNYDDMTFFQNIFFMFWKSDTRWGTIPHHHNLIPYPKKFTSLHSYIIIVIYSSFPFETHFVRRNTEIVLLNT